MGKDIFLIIHGCCMYVGILNAQNAVEKLPAIELVRVFLPGIVKVKTKICINANAKVVIHHIDLGVVFTCRTS